MSKIVWTLASVVLTGLGWIAPVAAQEPGRGDVEKVPVAFDEQQEAAQDARAFALLQQPPSLSALRMDELERPVLRLDVHFGRKGPWSRAERLQKARTLFAGLQAGGGAPEGGAGPRDVLLEEPPGQEGQPDGFFYDPAADLVVSWQGVAPQGEAAAFCMHATTLTHSYQGNTGETITYYLLYGTKMVSAAVSADRYSSADPDLYFKREYSILDWSTHSNRLDEVAYSHPLCGDFWGRVKVYMYSGGRFSFAMTRFWAF